MRNLILALAGMAVSGLAVAGPNWTYADIGYNRADSGDEETDGFQLQGSFGFADKYHVQATYFDGEVGGNGGANSNPDYDGYRISLGINPAVTDNTDFVFQIGYFDLEEDDSDVDGDDSVDGYELRVGLRSMLTDNVEIFGYVNTAIGEADCDNGGACNILGVVAADGDDFTEISAIVGGQYLFTDNIGLSLQYEQDGLFGDNATFGARWSF
ncbi:MAG: hypothetical protein ACR2QG_12430 [Gammaproteobacteria bacterium]